MKKEEEKLKLLDKINTKNKYVWANEKSSTEIQDWINNFDDEDQLMALNIALGIKFYSKELIRSSLVALSKKIVTYLCEENNELRGDLYTSDDINESKKLINNFVEKNCLFVSFGDACSSGAMLLYYYNKHLDFDKINSTSLCELFTEDKYNSYSYIFLIDDFIGTGDQAVETWYEKKCGSSLGEFSQQFPLKKIALTVLVASEIGIDEIENDIGKDNIKIIANDMITQKMNTFSPYSSLFKDSTSRSKARVSLYNLGKELNPRFPLGYGSMALTIAFSHNTPDNTLPVIWKKTNSWQPLFERHE